MDGERCDPGNGNHKVMRDHMMMVRPLSSDLYSRTTTASWQKIGSDRPAGSQAADGGDSLDIKQISPPPGLWLRCFLALAHGGFVHIGLSVLASPRRMGWVENVRPDRASTAALPHTRRAGEPVDQ